MDCCNPVRQIPRKRRLKAEKFQDRIFTDEEVTNLLAACGSRLLWLRELIQFALATGARSGELLALRWQDVDLEGHKIHFRHTLNKSMRSEDRQSGKALGPLKSKEAGEERIVPISSETAQRLRLLKIRSASVNPEQPVFANADGHHRNYGDLQRAFASVRDRAGLGAVAGKRAVRLHDCRHTFASNLLEDGESPARVAELIGDTLDTTIKRYLHPHRGADANVATVARLEARQAAWR